MLTWVLAAACCKLGWRGNRICCEFKVLRLIVLYPMSVIIDFSYGHMYGVSLGVWQLLHQLVIQSFGSKAKRCYHSTHTVSFSFVGFCPALLILDRGFHEYCSPVCSMIIAMLCAVYLITSWIIDGGYGRKIPHFCCVFRSKYWVKSGYFCQYLASVPWYKCSLYNS